MLGERAAAQAQGTRHHAQPRLRVEHQVQAALGAFNVAEDVDLVGSRQGQRGRCAAGFGNGAVDGDVARTAAVGTVARAGGGDADVAGVQCAANRRGLRTANGVVVGVDQPQAGCAQCFVGGPCVHAQAVNVNGLARGFHLAAMSALGAALGQNAALCGGDRLCVVNVAPQHHLAAVALLCGAGVNAGAAVHGHGGGLAHGASALPVATQQHGAATCGASGVYAAGALEVDAVGFQGDCATLCALAAHIQGACVLQAMAGRHDDASALELKACGLNGPTVFHHAAHQPVHRLRADDDQPARGLHGQLVVHQRGNLAGFYADAGQAVVAVELQVNRFARGQGHAAHLRDHRALVADLGGEQRDVAAQGGFELALVDHAAGGAIALKAIFTSHEVGVADAVRGGQQATHVHPRVFAKVHTSGVGQHHLAVGADAAKDLARVVAQHAVERDAVGAGLHKLHLRVFAHVEGLPVDGGAVGALLDDHVCAALADAGLACADLPGGGQCAHRWGSLPVRMTGQQSAQQAGERSGHLNA